MPLDDYANMSAPPPLISSANAPPPPMPPSNGAGLMSVGTPPPMSSAPPMVSSAASAPPAPPPTFNPFANGVPMPGAVPTVNSAPLGVAASKPNPLAVNWANASEGFDRPIQAQTSGQRAAARAAVADAAALDKHEKKLSPEQIAALQGAQNAQAAQDAQRASAIIPNNGGGMPSALTKGIKDFRDESNKADTSKEDALDREQMNQAMIEAQRQDVIEQQARDAVAAQAAHQKAFEDYQQAHKDQVDAITAAQQQAASARVDPNHFYATRTAGQQIALAIGAALGGALAGLKGGSNTFMDQVNGAIDRDNNAQKFNVDNKWNAVKGKQDMLAAMERNGVDQRNAAVFQRGLQLEAARAQLDKLASSSQSADVQRNAAWMRADLQKEIAKNNLNATVELTPKGTGAPAGAANPAALGKDLQSRYVPGAGGIAKDAETATKLNDAQADADADKRLIAEAQTIREKQGYSGRAFDKTANAVTGYNSAELARLKQIEGKLIANFRKREQLRLPAGSQLSSESQKLIDEHVGSLTDVGDTGVSARLRGLASDTDRDLQDLYKSHGIQQIQQGYARDANGNLVPVAGYTGANSGAPSAGAAMPTGFKPAGAP